METLVNFERANLEKKSKPASKCKLDPFLGWVDAGMREDVATKTWRTEQQYKQACRNLLQAT